MSALWVEITSTRGSAPRNAGTAMKVTAKTTEGTIGGGALEYAAINRARQMLAEGNTVFHETLPLGPNLGQCCGGTVTLRYTDTLCATDHPICNSPPLVQQSAQQIDLWIWGAGHIGRAVVQSLPSHLAKTTWVDTTRDRFPSLIPNHVNALPALDMPLLAHRAPKHAHHLIFTYSHDIDLALCAVLLKRGFASCGLIGSDTKWARFQKRLRSVGLDPVQITCPIGDKSLGKAPAQIAQGILTSMTSLPQMKASA
ncbi:MAG: xanthine dehydrogenase accessory protein XdhC [Sulfitobacter sp.]